MFYSKFILINFIIFFVTKIVNCENNKIVDNSQIPKLPLPQYNESDGSVIFFPRIIGGTPAQRGDFPGKISLQTRNGFHICGGTIIHLTHVLTAAHCVTDSVGAVYHPVFFQLIADDLSIAPSTQLRQIRLVSLIFVHPEYNLNSILNDVAVMRTHGPFLTSNTLAPISRATFIPPAGSSCDVAGWGATEQNGPASPILLRVQVYIIGTDVCNSTESYNGFILPGMICAGHMAGGRDTCQGDSGGGLICNNLLAGVVSFGYGCGQPNFPGVYADVSVFNNWIDSVLFWYGHQGGIPTPTTVLPLGGTSIILSSLHLTMFLIFLTITI